MSSDFLGSIFSGVAQAFGGVFNYNQAKSDARWLAEEGRIKAQNEAKQIKQLVARQTNAFVANGLELTGTPQAVMQDTINTGIEDVRAMESSYQKRINSMVKQARANMFGGLLDGTVSALKGFFGG